MHGFASSPRLLDRNFQSFLRVAIHIMVCWLSVKSAVECIVAMQLQHFETKTKFYFCYGILTCIFVIQEERSCMELVYQLLQYFKMQEVCQAKFMTGKDDTVWPQKTGASKRRWQAFSVRWDSRKRNFGAITVIELHKRR
jgi:hypothetical protein